MAQTPKENAFNLLYIFEVIKKRLTFITVVVGVSALLAIILTLPFIYKPEFKSSTVIYPTAAERYDAINLFHDEPILYLYGESKDVEKAGKPWPILNASKCLWLILWICGMPMG